MKKLYEGKAKILYETDTPHVLVQRFKDAATAFNAQKQESFAGKGELNNRIAGMVFRYLESEGVSSHYLDTINARDMRVRKVDIIQIEVIVRSIVAGSLATRLGLDEGIQLEQPIIEFSYKSDALGDPLINDDHAVHVLKIATHDQLKELRRQALLVYAALTKMWAKAELTLVDCKLEFGTTVDGQIVLADEVSPDTQRLWAKDGERLDKDVFRRDLGDLIETYQQVHDRLEKAWPRFAIGALANVPSA